MSLLAWVDERIDLSGVRHFIAEKGVPVHAQKIWYYLGGMTLFLFGVQIFTGILLLLYYRPSASEAYESVQFIVTQVQFGWLIRNVHSWSANLLIGLAFAHFFSVFFLKSYRKPRELTWLSGILLLFLMLGFGFSGYLLPWNELSFFATKVGTGIAGAVPLVGHFTLRLLRGGDDVTGATLSRFYGLHVAVLPALTTLLVAVHLLFVQRQGMSVPLSVERKLRPGQRLPQMPFFPNYVLRDVLAWYVVIAVLAALAAFYPWELGNKADPFAVVPPGIRPEWYFLAMFHTLKLLPSHILGFEGEQLGVVGFGIAALFLVLVPFLDRRASRGEPSGAFRAARARAEHLRHLSRDAERRANRDAGDALFAARRPSRERVHLRRLPRRQSVSGGQGARARPGAAVQRATGRAGDCRDLRPLPQRHGVHAAVRAAPAGRSGDGVRCQRARPATGERRSQRRHLRELPRRARHPAR